MAESMSLSDALDYDSPYYLDEDEHPYHRSTIILSQAEDNFAIWKLSFTRLLRIKNKLAFVNGTLEKPDASSPLYKRWERCNALVMCWMWNSMTEELSKRVTFDETAHNMWEHLRRIFVPNVDLKIYQTRRKIMELRQDGDTVEKYFKKMSNAWLELSEYDPVKVCSCSGCDCEITKRAKEARDKEELYAFLMGLNKDLIKKSKIKRKKPPLSLKEAYDMVEEVELMMKWTGLSL
ncbi:unnamed protein product [Arabidopsis arenosa]|uniref:Retrotransposon Copia-like N-terminal domain-containing protein n=1 Tax=Arabidopsis arenosa TaxID=38785 RepID=A0A8S1ZEL7_ARAAE|nr:unnamed protein product [Arabidopsis arenosa]